MATTTITGPVNNINNDPFANKWIYFRLKQIGTDSAATAVVAQDRDSVQTDASGEFSIDVWDNGDSGVTSILEITIAGSSPIDVIIPASTASIQLWDLIENYQVGTASAQLPTNEALFMRKANNLSDVASASTARTNLGLGTAATTAATAYATAAQGTLADSSLQDSDIGLNVQAYSAVLGATTASYTSAEKTKLSGIETAADVTDATNIAAAGGYVAGGTDVAVADGGTGASTASAARTNLGFQANAAGSTTAVTATTYTVLTTDSNVWITESAETTVTLVAAATAGDGFTVTIAKLGDTANIIINGDAGFTATLTDQDESITLITNGTNWRII